jgi:chaperonin GroEL (HSP60 family)
LTIDEMKEAINDALEAAATAGASSADIIHGLEECLLNAHETIQDEIEERERQEIAAAQAAAEANKARMKEDPGGR